VVMPIIASLQDDVMAKLDQVTIEDLCKKARASGLECGDKEQSGPSADFTI